MSSLRTALRMDHGRRGCHRQNAPRDVQCRHGMTDSIKDRFTKFLFYVLIIVTGYLTYRVLSPFLAPLAWAAVFAMMFQGVHRELTARFGANRSALLTTLLTAVLIVAPGALLVSVLAREIPQVVAYLQEVSVTAPDRIERIWEVVRARVPMELPPDPMALIRDGIQRVLSVVAPAAGGVLADLLATLGSLFVMLFSMFFLLRDGDRLGRQIRDILPLPERQSEQLITETRDLVIASVGAGLIVAAAQGVIAGVAFLFLGFNGPVMWGVATGVLLARAGCWLGAGVGTGNALASGDRRSRPCRHPAHRWRRRCRDGGQRAAAAAAERPDIGERPRGVPGPAWRRLGVRLHRAGARADHPRDRREPARRVYPPRSADHRAGGADGPKVLP